MTHSASLPTPSAALLRSTPATAVTLLRVYGEDAFSYLQSQVSADLRAKGERWVRYALWLDSRGYVQADSFILRQSEASFLLFSYHTPADRLEEIVLANVIADDVEVEHLGDRYQHWALWAQAGDAGQSATDAGRALLPQSERPQEGTFVIIDTQSGESAAGADASGAKGAAPSLPVLLFAGRNAGGENYDLLLPVGAALPAFAAALKAVPWAQRQAQRIADGVPAVPADVGTGDLPQEGGDLARIAVSTTKGCYLGQEVIARWHATGQVRSGLYRLRLADAGSANAVADAIAAAAGSGAASIDAPATGADGNPASGDGASVGNAAETFLPLRLYAGAKPVGQLRSFAPQAGAGLALLRIHRLAEARALSVEAGGPVVFKVLDPMLS